MSADNLPKFTVERTVVGKNGDGTAADIATDVLGGQSGIWVGASEKVLEPFGVKAGTPVTHDILKRVLDGKHAKTPQVNEKDHEVRKKYRVLLKMKHQLEPGDVEGKKGNGVVQVSGSMEPSADFLAAWWPANDAHRAVLEERLFESLDAGVRSIANADHVGSAATLQVAGARGSESVRIDWAAIGALRDGKLVSPCEPKFFEDPEALRTAELAAAEPLKNLPAPQQAPEKAAEAGAEQAPENAADSAAEKELPPEPAVTTEQADEAQAAVVAPAAAPRPIHRVVVMDSLDYFSEVIDFESAREIRANADQARIDRGFGDMSTDALIELTASNPFGDLVDWTPSEKQLQDWALGAEDGIVTVVAAEQELFERALRDHRDRAAREVTRRGVVNPDAISLIREARKDWSTFEVDRLEREAVFKAGDLQARPIEQLDKETAQIVGEVKSNGGKGKGAVENASADQLARLTAIQYARNIHNEELARAQQSEAAIEAQHAALAQGTEAPNTSQREMEQ